MDLINTDLDVMPLQGTPNHTFPFSYSSEVEEALMRLQKSVTNFQAVKHVPGHIQKFLN
jgi:hypothetical protein